MSKTKDSSLNANLRDAGTSPPHQISEGTAKKGFDSIEELDTKIKALQIARAKLMDGKLVNQKLCTKPLCLSLYYDLEEYSGNMIEKLSELLAGEFCDYDVVETAEHLDSFCDRKRVLEIQLKLKGGMMWDATDE